MGALITSTRRMVPATVAAILVSIFCLSLAGQACFESHPRYPLEGRPVFVAAADFDEDGNTDLAVTIYAADTVVILLGDGSGGIASESILSTPQAPGYVTTADLNGDGHADLAIAARGGDRVAVRLGDGAGGFAAPLDFYVGDSPNGMGVADIDEDGDLDMIVSNYGSDNLTLHIGNGIGNFYQVGEINLAERPRAVATVDFNLFLGGTVDCRLAVDADDNETLNLADALYMLAAQFLGGPLPLAPFPECGPDPTAGALECAEFPVCVP